MSAAAAYIPAAQLLALFCRIEDGITPDSPSTGAITHVGLEREIHNAAAKTRTECPLLRPRCGVKTGS